MSKWDKKAEIDWYDQYAKQEVPNDKVVSVSSAMYKFVLRTLREILNFIELDNRDYILDAGCGAGRIINLIKESNVSCHVVGLDSSLNMIRRAKKRAANYDYVLGDVLHLPFKNAIFTKIICISVLWHIPSKTNSLYSNVDVYENGLREFKRALTKNGIIVVNFKNPVHLQSMIDLFRGFISQKVLKKRALLTYMMSFKTAEKLRKKINLKMSGIFADGYYPIFIETLYAPFRQEPFERSIMKYYNFFNRIANFLRKHFLAVFFAYAFVLKFTKTKPVQPD